MFGNLVGAVTGILVTGLVLVEDKVTKQIVGGIPTMFVIYAIVYFLGVVAWMFIDASKPIVGESHTAAAANV